MKRPICGTLFFLHVLQGSKMRSDYENFTDHQKSLLDHYVTNTSSSVFVLRNLPEVIKGALFSRYSRSSLGLRSLLLKEFIQGEETEFDQIAGHLSGDEKQLLAIKRAQNFYDRILDGYGDDSIGELGGAHLAVENVSMIAAKEIEDCRIGGSPLEKSARYVFFGEKVDGEYLYFREPIIMTSAYKELYVEVCDTLFETYSALIPPLTEYMEKLLPKDPEKSKTAYNAALKAKVLDCLRGLLPAGTLTNLGMFGNGRFYESLIHKLRCNPLAELQDIGAEAYNELHKVIPSFVRRSDGSHHTHEAYAQFMDSMRQQLKCVAEKHPIEKGPSEGVKLVSYDEENVYKVVAALLFAQKQAPLDEICNYAKGLDAEQIAELFDAVSSVRENRRQKSPRALEHASFTFEITADFGIYRDLHRHRILTQERQLLTTDLGYYTPYEVVDAGLEKEYKAAMLKAKEAYDTISSEFPEEAQYVVPMAYNVRWYFHVNLRSLQWLCELRSGAAGHPNYRFVAQEMARQVSRVHPEFESFFKFVDYEGYELGRMDQEQRKAEKRERAGKV
jgi:thymidylate synthase ThyX